MTKARDTIKAELAKVSEAKRAANAVIKREQDACAHQCVLERPSGVTGYRYINNRWFPAVRVCADCGLVEEKEQMTPLYNTYEDEKQRRLPHTDYKIDEKKLAQISIRLLVE